MELEQLVQDAQTLVVVNHSGGKDSQAMYLFVRNLVPADRLVVIHAHLPGVEWPGIVEHIEATTDHEFHTVLRAQESSGRAKKAPFRLVESNTNSRRDWYEWLPIHSWTTTDVFDWIASQGQEPHWAYAAGMSRLSCCFCIMASQDDLATAARLQPALFERYTEMERRLQHTLIMPGKDGPKYLDEIVAGAERERKAEATQLCIF